MGGGFGGKSAGLQADEAARLAVITGKPVMVAWTRAEEFFHDSFDPAWNRRRSVQRDWYLYSKRGWLSRPLEARRGVAPPTVTPPLVVVLSTL